MRIGLIDVDNYEKLDSCFPNLVLMKISSYYKAKGYEVEFYDLMQATIHYLITGTNYYNKVYMSKVFSFTSDYQNIIYADEIIKGGSGYCISLVSGKEIFDKSKDTAFGFMSRGCPRGCGFCHVAAKEGRCAYKVADLSEFWNGQKYIQLMDPNTLACKEWESMLQQLIDCKATVDFNQGVDIRLMTKEKTEMIKCIKTKNIHFAWDKYEDKNIVVPRFEAFKKETEWGRSKVSVYCLCGFKEKKVLPEDIERIMFLRSLDFNPYVMLYDKEHIPQGHELRKLQRWVNNKIIFWSCPTFKEYLSNKE